MDAQVKSGGTSGNIIDYALAYRKAIDGNREIDSIMGGVGRSSWAGRAILDAFSNSVRPPVALLAFRVLGVGILPWT